MGRAALGGWESPTLEAGDSARRPPLGGSARGLYSCEVLQCPRDVSCAWAVEGPKEAGREDPSSLPSKALETGCEGPGPAEFPKESRFCTTPPHPSEKNHWPLGSLEQGLWKWVTRPSCQRHSSSPGSVPDEMCCIFPAHPPLCSVISKTSAALKNTRSLRAHRSHLSHRRPVGCFSPLPHKLHCQSRPFSHRLRQSLSHSSARRAPVLPCRPHLELFTCVSGSRLTLRPGPPSGWCSGRGDAGIDGFHLGPKLFWGPPPLSDTDSSFWGSSHPMYLLVRIPPSREGAGC